MYIGYVKLERTLMDDPIWENPRLLKLYLYLKFRASFEEREMAWCGENMKIPIGSFITGLDKIKLETGLPKSTVRDYLDYLEKCGKVRTQITNKWRMITVLNQDEPKKSELKPHSSRTQAAPNKNVKNVKECKIFNRKAVEFQKNDGQNREQGAGTACKEESEKRVINKIDYSKFGMPKKTKAPGHWQEEAQNASKYFLDGEKEIFSVFRCFKDNEVAARNAFSDCKELGKQNVAYFFKTYHDVAKKQARS